jgi:hypothetical protein
LFFAHEHQIRRLKDSARNRCRLRASGSASTKPESAISAQGGRDQNPRHSISRQSPA